MAAHLFHDVYFSLGSNLGDRLAYLRFGLQELRQKFDPVQTSAVYETQSWGYDDAPYLNIVARFKTENKLAEIIQKTQEIEKWAGRKKNLKLHNFDYRGRTLDIDLLFYDQWVYKDAQVEVPHPRLHLRKFVLLPFAEINDSFVHPVFNKTIKELISDCNDKSQVKRFDRAI